MSKILVPTDFSPAAENAFEFACQISSVGNQEIELLHIKGGSTEKLLKEKNKTFDQLEQYLDELCKGAIDGHAVKANYRIEEGSILTTIPAVASEPEMALVVMGTHGTRGIRQKLLGADALKIAERSAAPVLTVPDVIDAKAGIKRIIFPYGGHENFENKVNAVAMLASHFNADVHFYSIQRAAADISKDIQKNIEKAEAYFTQEGIAHERVKEGMTEYSVGFANQTIKYAKKSGANMIAVMAGDKGNLSFISSVDRENLINNDQGIAILLVSE
jgi:nucleotide-binding universal stress UspA family protein